MKRGHPKALPVLFLAEMWERFGVYIVQGTLILYLTKALDFTDSYSYSILGAFTALIYISPIFGGFVADQILGFRKTIVLGNILLALGYAFLAMPIPKMLYFSLALVIMGTGFFKPNISSYLSTFYKKNDSYRNAGYTIFYVSINLGILLSTSLSGFIQKAFGWYVTFATGSLGLLIGLTIFIVGMYKIDKLPDYDKQKREADPKLSIKNFFGLSITTLLLIVIFTCLIVQIQLANYILLIASGVLFGILIYQAFQFDTETRNKFIALIFLIMAAIIFWAVYFQLYFSLNLFVDRLVDRSVLGIEIPAVMFIGLVSVFIILLGPLFALGWRVLHEKNRDWSTAFKFALANFVIGLAFLALVLGINLHKGLLLSPLWILLTYFLITVGELLLSPIGLAMVTVLAPRERVGLMMGVWLTSLGLGGKLAGVLAQSSSVPKGIVNPVMMFGYYQHAFTEYGIFALIASGVILVSIPALRLMEQGISWRSLKKVIIN